MKLAALGGLAVALALLASPANAKTCIGLFCVPSSGGGGGGVCKDGTNNCAKPGPSSGAGAGGGCQGPHCGKRGEPVPSGQGQPRGGNRR